MLHTVKTTLWLGIVKTVRSNVLECTSRDDCPSNSNCYSHIKLCDESLGDCLTPWHSTLSDLDHRMLPHAINNGYNSIKYYSEIDSTQYCHPKAAKDERCFLTTSCNSPMVCKQTPVTDTTNSQWFCNMVKCDNDDTCGENQKCYSTTVCDETMSDCIPGQIIYETEGAGQKYCLDTDGQDVGCDEMHSCPNGETCQAGGVCKEPCESTSDCKVGEECIYDITYCTNNDFDNCGDDVSNSQYIKYFNEKVGGSSGYCYTTHENGASCNEDIACLSGFCDNGMCLNYCNESHKSCKDDEQCITWVMYCNDQYENCSGIKEEGWPDDSKFHTLRYDYDGAMGGTCYKQSGDDNCDYNITCGTSDYCDHNQKCLVNECQSTADCSSDEECIIYHYCDSTYSNCSEVTSDVKIIQYIEINGETRGRCSPPLSTGESCDYDTNCEGGWCLDGKCEYECNKDRHCSDGSACISDIQYCNANGVRDYSDCTSDKPDNGPYIILYSKFDENYNEGGSCMVTNIDYQQCDDKNYNCITGLCGYDGTCNILCSEYNTCDTTPDGRSEICVVDVKYCGNDYANCTNVEWDGYETLRYDEFNIGIDYYGLCMPVVDTGCDAFSHACDSGYCNKDHECQHICDIDHPCESNELCLSSVTYCNEEYNGCTTDIETAFIKYQIVHEGSEESGLCYSAGGVGDPCDTLSTCQTEYCGDGECIYYASKCDRDLDCPYDNQYCMIAAECNEHYQGCSELDRYADKPVIRYEFAESKNVSFDGQGYCRYLNENDEKCDEWQQACVSGWCNENKTCENYCHDKYDCPNGQTCYSGIKYCDYDGNCSDVPQALYTGIEYVIGEPGICLESRRDGESCDDVDYSCKSGYCHGTGHCATKCNYNDSDPCPNSTERCINSVEYCENIINNEAVNCDKEFSDKDAINYHPAGVGAYGASGICMAQGNPGDSCDSFYRGCNNAICNQISDPPTCSSI